MWVTAETIIQWAALIAAISVISGLFYKMFQWYEKQKDQDVAIQELKEEHKRDIANIHEEQCVLCYGIMAALDGLKQLGANGNVTKAHEKLEKHLNQSAHNWKKE